MVTLLDLVVAIDGSAESYERVYSNGDPRAPDDGAGVWVSADFPVTGTLPGDVILTMTPDDLSADIRLQVEADRWYEGAWHKIAGWGWRGPWGTEERPTPTPGRFPAIERFAGSTLRFRVAADRPCTVALLLEI